MFKNKENFYEPGFCEIIKLSLPRSVRSSTFMASYKSLEPSLLLTIPLLSLHCL